MSSNLFNYAIALIWTLEIYIILEVLENQVLCFYVTVQLEWVNDSKWNCFRTDKIENAVGTDLPLKSNWTNCDFNPCESIVANSTRQHSKLFGSLMAIGWRWNSSGHLLERGTFICYKTRNELNLFFIF